jgi:DDE superfamily endonuclease
MGGTVNLSGIRLGRAGVVGYLSRMTTRRDPLYAGYRHPAELISYAVWLYFRFPLSLRMVEEMLAARGILVTHETIRQWGLKFGREFADRIRRRAPCRGDKWHLDEVVITIAGTKHWLWCAIDQEGFVRDVLVPSRRDKKGKRGKNVGAPAFFCCSGSTRCDSLRMCRRQPTFAGLAVQNLRLCWLSYSARSLRWKRLWPSNVRRSFV